MIRKEQLSPTWKRMLLRDAVEFLDYLRRPVTKIDRTDGQYPYYGANGQQGTIDDFIFDEPLILLAEDGGNFGQEGRTVAYKVEGKCWVNNHAHVLRPKPNVDINFLLRHLEYYDVTPYITGTTRGKLTKDAASRIELVLPPLPEQKRIAAILDKADAIRRKRQQAVKLTEELLRSVFLDMFGDPVTNPKGWETRAFAEVCETRLGKMLDANQQTGEHLRPYLRNSNIQWDRIETTDLEQMDFNEKDRKTFSLMEGDVLICEGGEVGRAAVWRNQLSDCYFQKAIHRARPNQNLAHPEYIMYWLWFMAKNGGFKDHVTSATIAHLTGEKLKEIQMALPPIELQRKFIMAYNKHLALKTKTNKHVLSADTLFNSLLQRAFMGAL